MEERHDNLQNADGRKKEEDENKDTTTSPSDQEETQSASEESMIAESERTDPEMLVSTEEETPETPLTQTVEEQSQNPEAQKEEDKEESIDASAMIRESEKKSPKITLTDDDLEGEDEHEEIHSDEDEHDEHAHHELELPDYGEYNPEQLIAAADKLLKNEPVQKIREHFDSIRRHLLKQLNDERQQKLNEFVESGGSEIDFQYVQPLREKFRQLFSDYRARRQQYYKQLQETLDNNLKIKNNLIEQLKEIVNKEESIGDTFKEFNQIQQEWRNTGPVPRSESADLWRTYHHHVENFYEYIKINKELRDLDFKKNREQKEALIAKTEALADKENVQEAFKELQQLHKKWKNVGPVERENREPMWERFSEATRKIHEKRDRFFDNLREKSGELIEEKKKLIQALKEFPYRDIGSHHKWQEAIKTVEQIREDFRRIGRINHPENDTIWDEFRSLLRDFNHHKNDFYKNLKKEHHVNLEKKRELVSIAESLKDSDDWRETTNAMKNIQAEWKRIGHVPKSESDKIWKQFRSACNHFFDRLTEHNKDRDMQFEGNYTQKAELLDKLKAYDPPAGQQKEAVAELKNIIGQWKDIGRVPRDKNPIESEFNKVLDTKFKAIDLDRREAQKIRFENKMESLTEGAGSGDDRQLRRERQAIHKQIDEARKELNQLETNLSFFSSSNPDNPLLKEARKNIARQHEQIELLEEKQKMLNVKIREVNKDVEE